MLAALFDLLIWVCVLYVADSFFLLSRGERLFSAETGRGFRQSTERLQAASILPTAIVHVVAELPFRLSTDGIHPRSGGEPIAWEAVDLAVAERRAVVVEPHRFRVGSRVEAERLVSALREIAASEDRVDAIGRFLAARHDAVGARAHRDAHTWTLLRLAIASSLLAAGLFVLIPGLAILVSETASDFAAGALLVLLGLVAIGHVAVAFLARAAHREALPDASGTEVFVPLILFPPSTPHALAHVSRDFYAGFSAEAVAGALSGREESFRAGRRALYRLARERSLAALPRLAEAIDLESVALLGLLSGEGFEAAAIEAAPERRDPAALAYCPLCDGEWKDLERTCDECGEPVVPFGSPYPLRVAA